MPIAQSELIINPDGSIYHLNLLPEDIASTVIFVGDPARVARVSKYFDTVDIKKSRREFVTHTGTYRGKRITVISTGIGPDNIDIVMNELDALVNIDFKTRTLKEKLTSLDIVRVGTSGSLQADIPVDNIVLSQYAIGFDGMLHAYQCEHILEAELEDAFIKHTGWSDRKSRPYLVKNSHTLETRLKSDRTFLGITATAIGFYGPQGRVLRLALQDPDLNRKIDCFSYNGMRITNLEMESAAIYGLSKLLGHHACSLNAIIANRANRTFSKTPGEAVENLIQYTLNKLTT